MLHHQIFVDMFFTVEDLAHQSKWQLLEKLIIKCIELSLFHFSWSPNVNKEDQSHTMSPELLYQFLVKCFFHIIHDKEICLNKFFLPHLQLLQEIQNKHVYAYIWKIDTNASMLHHQIFMDMFFTVEDLAHQSGNSWRN